VSCNFHGFKMAHVLTQPLLEDIR